MPAIPPTAAAHVTNCAAAEADELTALVDAYNAATATRSDSFKTTLPTLIGAAMTEEVYGDNPPAVISVDEVYPVPALPYVQAPFAGATLKFQGTAFDAANAVTEITGTWNGAPVISAIFTVGDFDYPCGIGDFMEAIQLAP